MKDAFRVRLVRDACAIVPAKTNLAEWNFSPDETVNSVLASFRRNPYRLDRVTAGSSGGAAAAVAASFRLVGLGSDTGNSIRGPNQRSSSLPIPVSSNLATACPSLDTSNALRMGATTLARRAMESHWPTPGCDGGAKPARRAGPAAHFPRQLLSSGELSPSATRAWKQV